MLCIPLHSIPLVLPCLLYYYSSSWGMHADWKKKEWTHTNKRYINSIPVCSLALHHTYTHTHNGTFEIQIENYFVDANKEYNYTMPIQTMIKKTSQTTSHTHTKQESE